VTDKSDASTDAPAPGERIVIRDKRKVSPSSGTENKLAESNEPNGSEAAASEPAASDKAADKASDKAAAAAPAEEDQAAKVKPAGESTEAGATKPAEKPAEKKAPADEKAAAAEPEASPEPEPTVESAELGELRSALDERTSDLQRITAEYANYRKRVERDRAMAGELAVGMVLTELLAVLDDIDRARDHDDLNGPFAAVADKLTTVTSKFGLTAFGAKGDAFDPNRHEAVAHQTSSEVTEPTCIEIMRRGYLLGERLLRPALVAVADPESE
jgi:molecular chaperone GrpE